MLIGIYGAHPLRRVGGLAVGLLYTADGVGVVAGSLVAARLPGRQQRLWYALSYVLQGALWASSPSAAASRRLSAPCS